jgi:mono/diheme cytochrome c family protein
LIFAFSSFTFSSCNEYKSGNSRWRIGARATSSWAADARHANDATNPAALWLLDGEVAWNRKAGAAAKSCADCHGEAAKSMKGVAASLSCF